MKHSIKTGLSFGLTSSIITTLGLIVGLYYGTQSKLAVLGGIITIAIADSLSDSLGIHVAEESEAKHNKKEIWESTFSTFFSKALFTLTFLIPILFLPYPYELIISIFWGLSLLSILSFFLAKNQNISLWKTIIEHNLIAILVICLTFFIGKWISTLTI